MDDELFGEYIEEVFESLAGLDEQFIALESSPDDVEIIDSIFRPVHSIKGSSSFFGLDHITSFSHKLENLLDDLRKGKRDVTKVIIDNLLKGTDFLKGMFDRISDGDMTHKLASDEATFIENLEAAIGGDGSGDDGVEHKDAMMYIDESLVILQEMKSSDILDHAHIDELIHNLTHAKGEVPESHAADKIATIGEILADSGVCKNKIDAAEEKKGAEEKLGAALIKDGTVTEEQVSDALHKQGKKKDEAETKKKQGSTTQKTMRIDQGKVDEFMDQVGELVIISEVFNYLEKRLSAIDEVGLVSKEFKNANITFSELTLRLQHGLSEVRKVAIKTMLQKVPRIVRDTATLLGKEIDVVMSGEDTMLDKSLIEKLESPIIHMVRNSVDHGVEMPEKRIAAGKPARGKVEISANIEGEWMRITLADDGGGIPRAVISKKAVEKQLATQEEVDAMPDGDIFQFIFSPGFSTAAAVTDISGRGVGMDVVKRSIEDVKGYVEIESKLGVGSTFTIMVPVSTTLVTINGLVTSVGKGKFIFPVEDVKETLRPSSDELFCMKEDVEMVNIRGDIYPLIRLHERFSIETEVTEPSDGVCIIIEKNGCTSCIMADNIVEQQNVVLKDLGKVFNNVTSLLGGAILGDGSIGLVVSVEGIMKGSVAV